MVATTSGSTTSNKIQRSIWGNSPLEPPWRKSCEIPQLHPASLSCTAILFFLFFRNWGFPRNNEAGGVHCINKRRSTCDPRPMTTSLVTTSELWHQTANTIKGPKHYRTHQKNPQRRDPKASLARPSLPWTSAMSSATCKLPSMIIFLRAPVMASPRCWASPFFGLQWWPLPDAERHLSSGSRDGLSPMLSVTFIRISATALTLSYICLCTALSNNVLSSFIFIYQRLI
jgi:hypothetical protein